MKRTTLIWMIAAVCLVFIGSIVFGGVMMFIKWDFTKLSTVEYETNTYELSDSFNDISVISNTSEIEFIISDNKQCKVVCYEEVSEKHSVSVENVQEAAKETFKKELSVNGILLGTQGE